MPPVGFELTISASERQHTCSLDRAVTGKCTGSFLRVQMNTVTSVTGQFKRVTAVREVVDVLNISVYVLSLGSPRHPMFVKPCLYQDNEQAGWIHDISGLSSVGAWLNSDPGCYLPCGSSWFSSAPPNTWFLACVQQGLGWIPTRDVIYLVVRRDFHQFLQIRVGTLRNRPERNCFKFSKNSLLIKAPYYSSLYTLTIWQRR